ncbi:MAG: transposase, partial [Pseudomonadota bacterium]
AALRLFLGTVEQCLRAHSAGAGPAARLGAVAFIHRFGSALNPHLHFHCVVIDGVFEATSAGSVVFHPATGLDGPAIATVQTKVRRRLLQSFVRRGLLAGDDARAMQAWAHGGGFSVDAAVRIEASDRPGLTRLLRYGARPPFALERLRQRDAEHLIYENTRPGPGGSGPQILTPLQLIDRLAALIPPPRVHRHRYYGVLAPNSRLRPAVTAMALPAATLAPAAPPGNPAPPADEPAHRRAARSAAPTCGSSPSSPRGR